MLFLGTGAAGLGDQNFVIILCLSTYSSIQKQHAVLTLKDGEITIKPAAPGAKTKVNGMPLPGERVLKHLDRVLFGEWKPVNSLMNFTVKLKLQLIDKSWPNQEASRCKFQLCLPFVHQLTSASLR